MARAAGPGTQPEHGQQWRAAHVVPRIRRLHGKIDPQTPRRKPKGGNSAAALLASCHATASPQVSTSRPRYSSYPITTRPAQPVCGINGVRHRQRTASAGLPAIPPPPPTLAELAGCPVALTSSSCRRRPWRPPQATLGRPAPCPRRDANALLVSALWADVHVCARARATTVVHSHAPPHIPSSKCIVSPTDRHADSASASGQAEHACWHAQGGGRGGRGGRGCIRERSRTWAERWAERWAVRPPRRIEIEIE